MSTGQLWYEGLFSFVGSAELRIVYKIYAWLLGYEYNWEGEGHILQPLFAGVFGRSDLSETLTEFWHYMPGIRADLQDKVIGPSKIHISNASLELQDITTLTSLLQILGIFITCLRLGNSYNKHIKHFIWKARLLIRTSQGKRHTGGGGGSLYSQHYGGGGTWISLRASLV